ncbi:MAG: tetratricopeptide repeat protein [candidate division WOR-3 bacterium]
MKEYRWILLVSILFLFCFPFIYSLLTQDGLNPIIKNVQPSVASILTYDIEGKNIGQGIGFFISQNGDIITAYHVLLGASSAEIKTIDGKRYPIVTIVAEDVESDLIRASVDIPQKFVHTLKIGDSIPDVGEKVIVIGNTLELERTVSDGIISTVRETPKFGKIIQITAPISSNSSGSPVLNINGEIIGVATFQLTEGQNCNFAIPIEKVAKLLPSKVETFSQWGEGRTRNWISSAEGLYYTGIYFISIDDYKKALHYFKKAVEKNPLYADAYFQIGYCSNELGYYSEAIEAYKQVIKIRPDDADAHYSLGLTYGDLGYYSESIEAYKQAIRIRPDDADVHYNLGVIYGELGRYSEAIEAFKQAIRIKPDDVDAHYNLGLTYGKLGRYSEAIEAFRQAIRIKPDFADAHYNLGIIYLIIEDKGSALDEYKILKDLDRDLANELFNSINK